MKSRQLALKRNTWRACGVSSWPSTSIRSLQVQAQLLRGTLSSQLWAERADTAHLIDEELDNLRQRLLATGLEVGELSCRQGMPPKGPQTHLEQRWVDETA